MPEQDEDIVHAFLAKASSHVKEALTALAEAIDCLDEDDDGLADFEDLQSNLEVLLRMRLLLEHSIGSE